MHRSSSATTSCLDQTWLYMFVTVHLISSQRSTDYNIYMDVSINPGPWGNDTTSTYKRSSESGGAPPSCKPTTPRLLYSRNSLFRLRHYAKSALKNISSKIRRALVYLNTKESVGVTAKQTSPSFLLRLHRGGIINKEYELGFLTEEIKSVAAV